MNNRDVPIDIINRHGHVSSRMEEYALKKAERLLKFDLRISRIEIVVDGPHEEPRVEMIVHADRQANLIAKGQSDHFNGAVDAVVDKMERQLKKAKEKRKQHKGDEALKDIGQPGAGAVETEETFDDAVRKKLDQ